MRAYTIALALITFGFIVGSLNGLGICSTQLPGPTSPIGSAEIHEITEGIQSTQSSPLNDIFLNIKFIGVIFEGLKTALTIIPLMSEYRVPLEISIIIQGPIWFVYAMGIVSYLLNRPTKHYD